MARYTCWVCGVGYDGINCPTCAQNKRAEEASRRVERAQERAVAAMEEAVAEQTERLAEELERSREAAEEAAFETQTALAEAAEQHRIALEQAAEEHQRITANAWKLQSHAKSEQAYALYQSGMAAEALDLALQASKQDPSNIDAFFVIAASLERQGKPDLARPYLVKQIQLLSVSEYRSQMKYHLQVLRAIGTDLSLIDAFCTSLENNISFWQSCDSIELAEAMINTLFEAKQYGPAISVQRWILLRRGATRETLVCARRLIYKLSKCPEGLSTWSSALGQIIEWLENCKRLTSIGYSHQSSGGMSLIAVTYALDFATLLGVKNDIPERFFSKLRMEERSEFEKEFMLLRQISDDLEVDRKAFSSILGVARQKYMSWGSDLQKQIYIGVTTEVERLPKHNLGCMTGCIWFIFLIAVGVTLPFFLGRLYSSTPFSVPLGVVTGTVLLGAMSGHVIRSFLRYNETRRRLTSATTLQNAEFEGLGLPQIQTPHLRLRSPKIDLTLCAAVASAFFIGWLMLVTRSAESRPLANGDLLLYKGTGIDDDMSGHSGGNAYGVRWTHALGNRGAVFSVRDSSRIEYPALIPSEGTLEFWINVNDGYRYDNYQLKTNQNIAMIFSSDTQGGDVTWPGTSKLFVGKDGEISYWMAISKYNQSSAPPTEARHTKFRFGEWHALGVSYGGQGQYIMLDGQIVGSSPSQKQIFGGSGNHQQPLDLPTIGETVSHFWPHHRYDGGFEGIVARFRASAVQRDWRLARGVDASKTQTTVGTVSSSHEDVDMQQGSRTVSTADLNSPQTKEGSLPHRTLVSSDEVADRKISGESPTYSPIARAARVRGTVVLHAIISDKGLVDELTVVSGSPLLQQSALEAVRTWRYKPFLLNGVPSAVESDIVVVF